MKVYLHFNGELALKVKLPKKWPAEKNVTAIIEMFVENHNSKNPDTQLDAAKIELVDKADNLVPSDGLIGEVVQDYQDLTVREKVELVCEEVDPSLLTCCNGGCQVKKYREEDNHDKACQYHRLGPVFWDGGKYWGCCPDQKKWEWDDFICIPGCTIGRHSNVPPPKMAQEEMTNAPIAVPQGADPLTMHVDSVATYGESDEPAAKEDTVEVADIAEDGSTVCGNAGCRMKFNVNDPRDPSECHYHASPPVFHDGKKGYSCCNVHVYDFDDFMAIPTCAVGTHIPRMKKVKAGGLLDPE